jgi:hypothetical protein
MPAGIPFPIAAPPRPRPAGLKTAALQMSKKGVRSTGRLRASKTWPLSQTTTERWRMACEQRFGALIELDGDEAHRKQHHAAALTLLGERLGDFRGLVYWGLGR